ncbi:hypothetical protein [Terriglobus sp. RCC_193]
MRTNDEFSRLQRLQLAAAIAVGAVMLIVIVLRAWRGGMLP